MALIRNNLVNVLDVGSLFKGLTKKLMLMGKGFPDLSEDLAPNIEATTYVHESTANNEVLQYDFSMTADRDYFYDDFQKVIDKTFKKRPIGDDCKTDYYSFLKTDAVPSADGTTITYECTRQPVIVVPTTRGGAGGAKLVTSLQINGSGDPEEGYMTVTVATGEMDWTAGEAPSATNTQSAKPSTATTTQTARPSTAGTA